MKKFSETRIGGIHIFSPGRAQFYSSASEEDFRELAKQTSLVALQCSESMDKETWLLVNEVFFKARPDVTLRFYGYSPSPRDLSFVRWLTNVRHFSADSLMEVTGIEEIASFSDLESLSLEIFELKDFDILERVSPTLTSLSLGRTRSKKPSLAVLSRFPALEFLVIEGHNKKIEVLRELHHLECVTLCSVTTPDVDYLSELPKLWSLDIKLGGIRKLNGIEGKKSLKHLELWQIREFRDVDVISSLLGLQNLFLQSLPLVERIPSLAKSKKLRRVVLENMKGLTDFTALETAPALKEFALIDGRQQTPEQLLPVLKNPHIRRVSVGFGSDYKNNEFLEMREKYSKSAMDRHEPFEYR